MGLFSGIVKAAQSVASGDLGGAVQHVAQGAASIVTDPLQNVKEAAGAGIAAGVAPLSSTAWAAGLATEAIGNAVGSRDVASAGQTFRNAVADVNMAAINDPLAAAAVAVGGALIVTGVGAAPGAGLLAKGGASLLGGAMGERAHTEAAATQDGAPKTQAAAAVAPKKARYRGEAFAPRIGSMAAPSAALFARAEKSEAMGVMLVGNPWPGLWPVVRDWFKEKVRR